MAMLCAVYTTMIILAASTSVQAKMSSRRPLNGIVSQHIGSQRSAEAKQQTHTKRWVVASLTPSSPKGQRSEGGSGASPCPLAAAALKVENGLIQPFTEAKQQPKTQQTSSQDSPLLLNAVNPSEPILQKAVVWVNAPRAPAQQTTEVQKKQHQDAQLLARGRLSDNGKKLSEPAVGEVVSVDVPPASAHKNPKHIVKQLLAKAKAEDSSAPIIRKGITWEATPPAPTKAALRENVEGSSVSTQPCRHSSPQKLPSTPARGVSQPELQTEVVWEPRVYEKVLVPQPQKLPCATIPGHNSLPQVISELKPVAKVSDDLPKMLTHVTDAMANLEDMTGEELVNWSLAAAAAKRGGEMLQPGALPCPTIVAHPPTMVKATPGEVVTKVPAAALLEASVSNPPRRRLRGSAAAA